MMNVVNMAQFKEMRELKQSEEAYGRYLVTLSNAQLEIEVNALLEEFSGDRYGKDFFLKGQLILKEISSRADVPVRAKIESLASDTLKLF